MDILFYFFVFILGLSFGSFYTLATYRIPLGKDITHERSFCPHCNHKLQALDLIPVLSYVFLGGKCRYCKKPIGSRYIMIEILSGIIFVLFAMSIKFNAYNLAFGGNQVNLVISFIFAVLYITTVFILGGIDYEKGIIENKVLLFGVIVNSIYTIYLNRFLNQNVIPYIIYLGLFIVLLFANTFYIRKHTKNNYILQILMVILYMLSYTYEGVTIVTIIFTLLIVAFRLLLPKIFAKKKIVKNKKQERLPFGLYLAVANISVFIFANMLATYGWIKLF